MNSGTTVAAASSSSSAAFGDDQPAYHGGGFSAYTDTHYNISSGSSNVTNPGKKPIRRRSRVSKKTPITLLNADAATFRSLVQQFTGCPHPRPSSAISFDQTAPLQAHGPLNLNFQLGTVQPTTNDGRPGHVLLMQQDDQLQQQRRSCSPEDYHHRHQDVNHAAVSYQSTVSGGDDHSANHNYGYHEGDPFMRMGSHNLDLVQELLMVDHRDDFGFFQ